MANKVAITTVVKNRAWCLTYWLDCVRQLALRQPGEVGLIVLDDASTDDTGKLLRAFREKYRKDFAEIRLLQNKTALDDATSARDTKDRQAGYPHLAELRNRVVDTVKASDYTHQLSIDSDILAGPELLSGLLAHGLPYVSSIIFNDIDSDVRHVAVGVSLLNRWTNAGGLWHDGKWKAMNRYQLNTLYPCGYSGAVYLVDRTVLDTDARFGPQANFHGMSCEDYGYCWDLQQLQIDRHIDTTLRCVHLQVPACLQEGRGVYFAWFGRLPEACV